MVLINMLVDMFCLPESKYHVTELPELRAATIVA